MEGGDDSFQSSGISDKSPLYGKKKTGRECSLAYDSYRGVSGRKMRNCFCNCVSSSDRGGKAEVSA